MRGMEFVTAIRNLPTAMIYRLTNSWDDLIWDCSYQGQDCTDEKYFALTLSSDYGICFMFNSKFNAHDSIAGTRKSSLTGSEYGVSNRSAGRIPYLADACGPHPYFFTEICAISQSKRKFQEQTAGRLSLTMYLDQDDYMSNPLSQSAGVRLTVHSVEELPSPNEEGFYLQPTSHASIALKMVNISRLPEPYQPSCFSSWGQTYYSPFYPFNDTIPVGYSVAQCNRLCEIMASDYYCKCRNPIYMDYFQRFDFEYYVLPFCDITTEIRSVRHPNFAQQSSLVAKLGTSLGLDTSKPNFAISEDDIQRYLDTVQKNLLKADVYFQTLNLNVIEQQPKRDIKNLISDLGGILGIYLGLCLIVLIEIFEFLFLLAYNTALYFCCSLGAIRRVAVENPQARRDFLSKRSRSLSPRQNHPRLYNQYPPPIKQLAGLPPEYTNPPGKYPYMNPFTF
ncbi:unnamed protein product [Darwinula stevensoni]|uniref:Uncharacterized protein n=1 Tax=Darwinula stevensoni TaxID=69355 RepID=A0A7R9ADU7_9CRUS|nr:unnamed protein product [Darwinula stevensoni]CAG0901448.1 unnamed protein product [Darwinula stevensoni]